MSAGCWKCAITGHAMFCGCDCHAAEWEAAARRNRIALDMSDVLGTQALGPFEFEADRWPDGTIWRVSVR